MKKVIIVGTGIAGLTCAIYAQKSGFDTEIYELHSGPGGECTGWDRGEYHFDGCIHWLMGSKKGNSLNDLWRDTGALDDTVKILNHEIFSRYEEDGRIVDLYTNADKLEKHLTENFPADAKEIRKLCANIRKLGVMEMPLSKPMDKMSGSDGLKYLFGNMGKISAMGKLDKITMKEFALRFSDPLLQRALLSFMAEEYKASALVISLAGMNAGDCGYPMGGSRAFAKRMEETLLKAGGRIFYRSRVEKILTQDGKATGIKLTDGREITGDYVVSCADGYATLYKMLGGKYTPEMYKNLFENPKQYFAPTCSIVFAGIDCEKPDIPRGLTIKRDKTVFIGGKESNAASILNYGFDPAMAPVGKTVMACYYDADYDYWMEICTDKEKYRQEKEKLKEDAISLLEKRFPEMKGKVEQTDVVTPITYVHYCDAWRGAWMSWPREKGVPQYFPGILPGLSNFLMAGMWTLPPGGLPGASAAGKFAAQRLSMWEGGEKQTK